jgi:Lipocalin-like domain
MARFARFSLLAAASMLLFVGVALAQQPHKELIVGTWMLVSDENVAADGTRRNGFGPSPVGMAVFDNTGRFSVILTRLDTPKFVSNDRKKGTPEEYKASSESVLCYFGTYSVNNDRTLSVHIIGSSYPNWDGIDQRRNINKLTEDSLVWTTPTPPSGAPGAVGYVVWKRSQ